MTPLRVLIIEDSESDAKLVLRHLFRGGYDTKYAIVSTPEAMSRALDKETWDVVISDHTMPQMDAPTALQILKNTGIDIPFIVVSGNMGEDIAVKMMKSGAHDYLLKSNLTRLLPAVQRELRDAEDRRQRRNAQASEHRLENELGKIEERYRLLLNNASDAILILSSQCRLYYWNKSAEQIFGWRVLDAAGHMLEEMLKIHPAKLAAIQSELSQSNKWSGEMTMTNRDKKMVIMNTRWTKIPGETETGPCVLVIATDITGKKELELQMLARQREDCNTQLAEGIAYELNNLLSPVFLMIPTLRAELRSPEILSQVDALEANLKRGSNLIKLIQDCTQQFTTASQVLDINKLISETGNNIKESMPPNISVTLNVPTGLWPVRGDAGHLKQVLINLCMNSCDSMPNGGRLLISAENVMLDKKSADIIPGAKPGPTMVWLVADTGKPIPENQLSRVFDPIAPDGSLKAHNLELFAAMLTTRKHGGIIQVTNLANEGKEFRIYLPALLDQPPQQEDVHPPVENGNQECLLMVEDDPSIRYFTERYLKHRGYQVLSASNGKEALDIWQSQKDRIQMLVTDIVMPIMDGKELIQQIRKSDLKLPIIATTGLATWQRFDVLREAGVSIILQKPYSTNNLLSAIRQVLKKSAEKTG